MHVCARSRLCDLVCVCVCPGVFESAKTVSCANSHKTGCRHCLKMHFESKSIETKDMMTALS